PPPPPPPPTTAIRILGQPSSAGGVVMTDSLVRVGTRSQPGLYRGRILSLSGGELTARLTSGSRHARLDASLQINGAAVGGSTTMSPTA
ncbi:MAG: hypothetical protein ACR2KV_06505, partial [Solirubrobacteraceae bacterium]